MILTSRHTNVAVSVLIDLFFYSRYNVLITNRHVVRDYKISSNILDLSFK